MVIPFFQPRLHRQVGWFSHVSPCAMPRPRPRIRASTTWPKCQKTRMKARQQRIHEKTRKGSSIVMGVPQINEWFF